MADTSLKQNWTLNDAPRMEGKVAIVTGATGGLGFETALGLARRGATTILASRNADKGAQAVARIQRDAPGATVRFEMLDLASLASIAQFAEAITAAHSAGVNILVNNAGFMGSPVRLVTQDGFERQIGINYLGHFALTGRLKNALCAAPEAGRVVNVASLAHRRASLKLDDLQAERSYGPMSAYGQSKLAMLMFAIELQKRAERFGWNLRGIAAHPGWARTDIIGNGMSGGAMSPKTWLIERAFGLVAQPARDGALPMLYAAMAPGAQGGAYYGPSGLGETRGAPGVSRIAPQALDAASAAALWSQSEKLTGVNFGDNDTASAARASTAAPG